MQRRVAFISAWSPRPAGSTYLRVHQMIAMLAEHADRDVAASSGMLTDVFSDTILIFDKYATERVSDADLVQARRRGNRLLSDPVDGPFGTEILNRFDGVIAASHAQADAYRASLAVPVAYVGHHVDLRLGPILPRQDGFAPHYFGELIHARHQEALADVVKFISVNTKDAYDTSWMQVLNEASAHYALRPPTEACVYKPFTKGFIAGHCGVPLIVDAKDVEARHFLPPDYPYWCNGADIAAVRDMISLMRDDFATPQWHIACDMVKTLGNANSAKAVALAFGKAIGELA